MKLYHRRSRNFWGNILYPLNALKKSAPELYQAHRAKYDGREWVMDQRVPLLDCLWNDVLHLSPVHPERVAELARAQGLVWYGADWFEIDPAAMEFSRANSAVFRFADMTDRMSIEPDEFVPFDLARLAEMTEIPKRTRDYYATVEKGSARYFIFAGIPHVLHKGCLDVASTPLVRA
jgi:hypothetical protein